MPPRNSVTASVDCLSSQENERCLPLNERHALKIRQRTSLHVRLVIGISGASGSIYGIRALEILKKLGVETHLILTEAARETIRLETNYKMTEVKGLATEAHRIGDITSKLASGSFRTDGMAIIPCSMKSLSGVASGYADNLLLRAAEVTLKERRPLVLVVRETPLTLIDLENMVAAARAGAIVLPAMPAFYHRPKTVNELVNQVAGKALELLGVEHNLSRRWEGSAASKGQAVP
jgi:4-hydroxy-3-polyprenylbenzoate decarboxylase